MKTLTFNVIIDNGGEFYFDSKISEKDFALLKKFSKKYYEDAGDEFEDCENLSNLYQQLKDEAYDEMANSAYDDESMIDEFCDGEYDFDKMREQIIENFGITIEWPEMDD